MTVFVLVEYSNYSLAGAQVKKKKKNWREIIT